MATAVHKVFKDVAKINRPDGVYRNGRWVLVRDTRLDRGVEHGIITAMHDCNMPPRALSLKVTNFDWGRWTSSNNVLRGECNRCGEKVPDDIATLWTLFNFDEVCKG